MCDLTRERALRDKYFSTSHQDRQTAGHTRHTTSGDHRTALPRRWCAATFALKAHYEDARNFRRGKRISVAAIHHQCCFICCRRNHPAAGNDIPFDIRAYNMWKCHDIPLAKLLRVWGLSFLAFRLLGSIHLQRSGHDYLCRNDDLRLVGFPKNGHVMCSLSLHGILIA